MKQRSIAPVAEKPSPERPSGRFIPNLEQLQKAIAGLPDPETNDDDSYSAAIELADKVRQLNFTRKQIRRGNERTYRWIFDGKILIRKQDVEKLARIGSECSGSKENPVKKRKASRSPAR